MGCGSAAVHCCSIVRSTAVQHCVLLRQCYCAACDGYCGGPACSGGAIQCVKAHREAIEGREKEIARIKARECYKVRTERGRAQRHGQEREGHRANRHRAQGKCAMHMGHCNCAATTASPKTAVAGRDAPRRRDSGHKPVMPETVCSDVVHGDNVQSDINYMTSSTPVHLEKFSVRASSRAVNDMRA